MYVYRIGKACTTRRSTAGPALVSARKDNNDWRWERRAALHRTEWPPAKVKPATTLLTLLRLLLLLLRRRRWLRCSWRCCCCCWCCRRRWVTFNLGLWQTEQLSRNVASSQNVASRTQKLWLAKVFFVFKTTHVCVCVWVCNQLPCCGFALCTLLSQAFVLRHLSNASRVARLLQEW